MCRRPSRSLGQRHLHDFLGDALDLDVHLQGRDAVLGARDLEVHVAQMIFIAQDVGQHGELAAVQDQAHRHAGDVVLDRHAGVHHGQRTAADRSHRRGAVGLGDFRDEADGVLEVFRGRQQRDQRALGQAAVADFAALGHADATGFAGGERRHVVVHHEAVAVLAHERVDDLLVLLGAQRGHDQRLGFAAGEQGAAVSARQHAQAHADRAHGAGVAAVDARLAVQDLAAHDGGFQREQDVVDGDGVRRRLALLGGGGVQRGRHVGVDFAQLRRAGLLFADLVGGVQAGLGGGGDGGDQGLVLRRSLPVPLGLAGVLDQVMDGVDDGLHLLVAVDHAAEHDFLGQLVGFRFHHQHGVLVPATTRSSLEDFSCEAVGLMAYWPSM